MVVEGKEFQQYLCHCFDEGLIDNDVFESLLVLADHINKNGVIEIDKNLSIAILFSNI